MYLSKILLLSTFPSYDLNYLLAQNPIVVQTLPNYCFLQQKLALPLLADPLGYDI
jgi:hypothetical protein